MTHRAGFLALVLAGIGIRASAANLVVDPGFEGGVPSSYVGPMGDGWAATVGTGAICNIDHAGCGNAGPAHTGNQMAFLDWSNTTNTISQTLTTVPGQEYAISYWLDDVSPNSYHVTFGGNTIFAGSAPAGGNYVQNIFDATATSTSTVLAFTGNRSTNHGGTLLDDVSVVPVTTLQGGTTSAPVYFLGGSVPAVTGTIGHFGDEDVYSFYWAGGHFIAGAAIDAADPGTSYGFSVGTPLVPDLWGGASLNLSTNFQGNIDDPDLPPGQYIVGIYANSPSDPQFTIVFNTPVSGVPEPSALILLLGGLGVFCAVRGKKNRSKIAQSPN